MLFGPQGRVLQGRGERREKPHRTADKRIGTDGAFRGAGNCATSPHWPVDKRIGTDGAFRGAGNCARSPTGPAPGNEPHDRRS